MALITTKIIFGFNLEFADIDHQLYVKYGLSEEEVAFIEGMIKVM